MIGSYLFSRSLGAPLLFGNSRSIWAAWLFVVGCVIFLVFCGLDLLESMLAGAPKTEQVLRHMYFWGSVIFLIGTVMHTEFIVRAVDRVDGVVSPLIGEEVQEDEIWGTALFIIGSLVFTAGAFCNALDLNPPHDKQTYSRLSLVTCSFYEFGGLLFVVGSVCYLGPDLDDDCARWLTETGTLAYMIGSLAYYLADLLGLVILYRISRAERVDDGVFRIISTSPESSTCASSDTTSQYSDS